MASSPRSTTPTSLDDLPLAFRCNLTQYVGEKDLRTMRFLSGYWNTTAKATLHKRKRFVFNFENENKLVQFNDAFAEYEPTNDIATGHFCFQLPALDTAAMKGHLDTFVQTFGHLVTTLTLYLYAPRSRSRGKWFTDPVRRVAVLAHVTRLLQGVKGQLQHLDLICCDGLEPSVLDHGPLPRLQTLTVGNGRLPNASVFPADHDEAFILLLSRTVPAIQRFEVEEVFNGPNHGRPLLLPKVLRNLVRLNGQVEVKVVMDIASDHSGLWHELMTVPVRIVELDLVVLESLETLGMALNWIGAQSEWLRKLTFKGKFYNRAELRGLKLPSLRALEELNYFQNTVESLLEYDSANYFPNLRKVTTASTGNDFTVALPQVTDLTVYRSRLTQLVRWEEQGICGRAAFRFPPFQNVETLTCPVKFIDLGSIVQLKRLRRFTFRRDEFDESEKAYSFWKRVAHGARKLTLEQIRTLPEPCEDEVQKRAEPCFSDLGNLREFKMAVYHDERTIVDLDTLLWLTKTKRLQRLEKLELDSSNGVYNAANAVPAVYLTELGKYHNSVVVVAS